MIVRRLTIFLLPSITLVHAIPLAHYERNIKSRSPNVTFGTITYNGTGCPQGSATIFTSIDFQVFTFVFDDFGAQIGPDIDAGSNSKNCNIDLPLQLPIGTQYAIVNTTIRGYVDLDAGVSAMQSASYSFSNVTGTQIMESDFVGPVSEDFERSDPVSFPSLFWSPCGSQHNLKIALLNCLSTTDANATGTISTDSEDGESAIQAFLLWQQC